jgi:hypothetical protein
MLLVSDTFRACTAFSSSRLRSCSHRRRAVRMPVARSRGFRLGPPTVVESPIASPCRAADLHAELRVQGALGNLIGGVFVRNVGRAACSLSGRPSARFEGGPAAETDLRLTPVAADPIDTSLIYDRASSLRALGRGRLAVVPVLWSNWGPPDVIQTSIGRPPARLVLALPAGGELSPPVDRAPRCDAPQAPSRLAIKPFARSGRQAPPSSQLPLKAVIIGKSPKQQSPSLRARAGEALKYQVTLTNVSRRPFRFRNCPIYLQDLDGRSQRYVLNCRPVGPLRPRQTVRFNMVLRVPRTARPGRTGLFWLLGPQTYLPPNDGARVLITR